MKKTLKCQEKPCAFIVNPHDHGRKSIKKDNKVYLQDGQEFKIELYNPLKDPVLVEIKVNKKSVSSNKKQMFQNFPLLCPQVGIATMAIHFPDMGSHIKPRSFLNCQKLLRSTM